MRKICQDTKESDPSNLMIYDTCMTEAHTLKVDVINHGCPAYKEAQGRACLCVKPSSKDGL